MWHHVGLARPETKGLLAGSEKTFDGPSAAIAEHTFAVGEMQGIGKEILGPVGFGMLVVLDQGKPSPPVS